MNKEKSRSSSQQQLERAQARITELEEAQRLLNEYLITIQHDVRGPINTLLSSARLLSTEDISPDLQTELIKIMQQSAQKVAHAMDKTTDVYWLFNLEADRFEKISLMNLLEDNIPAVDATTLAQLPLAWGSPLLLERAIVNFQQLLDDGQSRDIEVNAVSQDDQITVHLHTKAKAMPDSIYEWCVSKETHQVMFEADDNLHPLSIGNSFIRHQGGQVWVKNTDAEGTTITFTVPMASIDSGTNS